MTAAYMNDDVRDAVNFLLSPPFAELSHSTTQSIPNNATTGLSYDTEGIDRDGGHSTSSNTSRYTGLTPGWYWVAHTSGFAANGTGVREWSIRLNGTTQKYFVRRDAPADVLHHAISGAVFLNGTTDYLETTVLQDSGGALNTSTSGGNPRLSVLWVSTA